MYRFLRKKKIVALIALVIAALLVAVFYNSYVKHHKLEIIQSPIVAHFIPMYRSLNKISDLFFIHHNIFDSNDYPNYTLTISPRNIQKLNEPLPDNPFALNSRLLDDTKVWVPAVFTAGDYTANVDVRYRGNQVNHWGNYKKSYNIKFPKDNLFEGKRDITIVIPSDRRYFGMSLNNYRSRKLDLLVPEEKFINLNLNGADHGVYIEFERFDQEWLEKNPISSLTILYNIVDLPSDTEGLSSVHSADGLTYWQGQNIDDPDIYQKPLKALIELVDKTDNETFEKLAPVLIDLDHFYARDIISILSGSFHNAGPVPGANNLVVYFDGTEGRFKTIPYNSVVFPPEDGFDGQPTDLQLRIWSIPEFKEERDQMFFDYVEENKESDINFLSNWMDEHKSNFLADFAKDETNISFLFKMDNLTKAIHSYFSDPFDILNRRYDYTSVPQMVDKTELNFSDSFVYLLDTIKTPLEFVGDNPQFSVSNGELRLSAGTHFFRKDVIVPVGTKLTIAPGATLYMDQEVSFVSYSPVVIDGQVNSPVAIKKMRADADNWGVFAIINTEASQSSIRHAMFDGGGEDTINGVYFSGMLAMHNADGEIINSIFSNTSGDDGVNVKKGRVTVRNNVFSNNFQDGIDVDYPNELTIIEENVFKNNGGDSIDLSWSDIKISNNEIDGCGDKGISAGESSNPLIVGNYIFNCDIGIASKDLSWVTVEDTVLEGNRIGISAYQKKPIFGGGNVIVTNSSLINNRTDFLVDNLSTINFEEN